VSEKCAKCDRGKEACDYCRDTARIDWEAICDCGLHDFDAHLFDCESVPPDRPVVRA
jgi:hypothetical protein